MLRFYAKYHSMPSATFFLDKLVKVALRSRTSNVEVNNEISLLCRVKGPNVPLSVTWLFEQVGRSSEETIVSVHHTGDVAWGREGDGYQLSTAISGDDSQYVLGVTKASLRNAGVYKCVVGAYLRQTQRASKPSNPLGVRVQKPGTM